MNALAAEPGKDVRTMLGEREMERGPRTVVEQLRHWRLAAEDGIAWLTLDRDGETANTLGEAVLVELDTMLDVVEQVRPKVVAIRSAKSGGFAAGADIREFRGITDPAAIEQRLTKGHGLVDRLAGLSVPTVAVIHGHCLGGGLELALACRHRIALPDAKLGFPEVLLGLHPGLGGTFRLLSLIDPFQAMTMMLTGKSVPARKARQLGLVDAVVEERHVAAAVASVAEGRLKSRSQHWKVNAFNLLPVRKLAAKRMRAEAEKKAPSRHYSAPYHLIDLWERHGAEKETLQPAEIRSFTELLSGRTAQNLIRVFFLREGLRANGKGESNIEHVHIVGGGTMGAEIAALAASRGLHVTLADLDVKTLGKAVGTASKFYDRKLHSRIDRRDALDRLMPDPAGDGIAGADLVIEAIAEKVEAKRQLFASLAPRMKAGAILATNTSSIPLETLAEGLPHPERFVGIHFFNPVTKMELVEVVSHQGAAEQSLARARAFTSDIGRLPAPVRSSPGFLVNRALTPYLVEAFLLLDEGMSKETIDRAATEFGMPMGPIELADRVGLDVGLAVARSLREAFPEELPDIPSWLVVKVESGELGRKAGKGLYHYDDKGRPKRGEAKEPPEGTADRLILPLLNTCVRLLREGVASDADTVDAAMIFATGFAPFRGGPLHYARERGTDDVVASLRQLEAQHGPRFAPDEGWHGSALAK
ncbi:MAG TPA: 3-hydroxyacyl-CoA dehydrogenase NAD-binding domain-containing protein [Bosea sp. (in: a-proteobacteria)]|jgi:3-hydroxyacyl-CoA dehydrogenase/enoyl-CoA hydratase/3-hydroxybutyryl-CoA epimerase|nr:3-hydroxyacyl-CoA dehydrogenase NAD-binding domain-containing protein [Bosea sp. (in: a-proteobacteria)]